MKLATCVEIFQWVGLIGVISALISFVGLWYFNAKLDNKKEDQITSRNG